MTFAWYGHLKFTDRPLWLVVVGELGHRLLRILPRGAGQPLGLRESTSAAQLKTMQEVITLVVFVGFSVLYLQAAVHAQPRGGLRPDRRGRLLRVQGPAVMADPGAADRAPPARRPELLPCRRARRPRALSRHLPAHHPALGRGLDRRRHDDRRCRRHARADARRCFHRCHPVQAGSCCRRRHHRHRRLAGAGVVFGLFRGRRRQRADECSGLAFSRR